MASVLNRTTKLYLVSVNEPDFPQQDWIWNPDISAVSDWPNRYWIITGDTVSLMDAASREALDDSLLSESRDSLVNQLTSDEDLMRALMLVVLEEFNNHALKINAILDAVDAAGSLVDLKTRIAAISDYPQRTANQIRTAIRNHLGI